MSRKRIRCECGRVYEPAQHEKCPACGAETNVATLERPKASAEDEPLVRQDDVSAHVDREDAQPIAVSKRTLAIIGGALVLAVVVILLLVRRSPARHETLASPTPQPAQTASAAPSATAQPTAMPIMTPPQSVIAPQSFDLAAAIASAAPGATIKVPPGLYQGGFVITKPVRLSSSGGQSYIQSDGRECLTVKSPGVFVQGVQFMCNGIGELPAISVAEGAELELDGCRVQSSTALGLTTTGNGSVSAIGTSFITNAGVAFRLQGGKANITQSTFADSKVGLYAMSGGTAELKSCAFERTGTGDTQGGIIFVTAQGASVSATDCHFTGNAGGVSVTNGASFTAANCEFKDNGASVRVAYGMIALSGGAKGTITGSMFDNNRIGVAVNDRGVLEMDQCTFTNNGIQGRQFILSTMPISITGQGSHAAIRNTKIDASSQFAVAMLDRASATLETVEISRAKVMGIGAGDTGSGPVQIEIRDSHLHHNTTGLGLYAGSSAKIENTEFRENQDGVMAGDKNTQFEAHKSFFTLNGDHGLCVFSEARAIATESQFAGNQRGAQSGLPRKSSGHASLTIEDSQIGANHVFGVGCYSQNELILRRVNFAGDDKQNIYKERNATVQVEAAEAKPSPTPEGEASATPEGSASPDGSASPAASATPSGTPSKSKRQQRQKAHRPEDDASRILRHIFGPH